MPKPLRPEVTTAWVNRDAGTQNPIPHLKFRMTSSRRRLASLFPAESATPAPAEWDLSDVPPQLPEPWDDPAINTESNLYNDESVELHATSEHLDPEPELEPILPFSSPGMSPPMPLYGNPSFPDAIKWSVKDLVYFVKASRLSVRLALYSCVHILTPSLKATHRLELTEYFLGWCRADQWGIVEEVLEETARNEVETFVGFPALPTVTMLINDGLGGSP